MIYKILGFLVFAPGMSDAPRNRTCLCQEAKPMRNDPRGAHLARPVFLPEWSVFHWQQIGDREGEEICGMIRPRKTRDAQIATYTPSTIASTPLPHPSSSALRVMGSQAAGIATARTKWRQSPQKLLRRGAPSCVFHELRDRRRVVGLPHEE
jgi:hypothetical protein